MRTKAVLSRTNRTAIWLASLVGVAALAAGLGKLTNSLRGSIRSNSSDGSDPTSDVWDANANVVTGSVSSAEAAAILKKNQELYAKAKFYTLHVRSTDPSTHAEVTSIIYCRNNADGTQDIRCEASSHAVVAGKRVMLSTVLIQNPVGLWCLFVPQKTAIRIKYLNEMAITLRKSLQAPLVALLRDVAKDSSRYQSRYGLTEEDGDYRIVMSFSPILSRRVSGDLASAMKPLMPGTGREEPPTASVPQTTVIRVQKKTYCLLTSQSYSADGARLSSIKVDSTDMSTPLADALFDIPTSFKLEIAENPTQFAFLLQKAAKPTSI